MRSMLATLTALLALGAGPAVAATRYAGPSGSAGAPCAQANPCSFLLAIQGAAAGDTVVVLPGSYHVNSQVAAGDKANLEVHGVPGQPRPDVHISGEDGQASLVLGTTAQIGGLDLTCTATDSICLYFLGAPTVHDLSITALSSGDYGLGVNGTSAASGWITDVMTRASGIGLAISNANAQVRNYTAVGTSEGIAVDNDGAASRTVTVRNSIFQGTVRSGEVQGAKATLNIDYSSYVTIQAGVGGTLVEGLHKVVGAPKFVSATDFHQGRGSPTIDAGTFDYFTRTSDFEGDARPLGAAVDVGADEFRTAPTVVTGAATGVTTTGATLAGTVDRQGETATWQFQYGLTAAYGSVTASTPAAGSGAQPASAALTALAPGTTYHYRLVATDGYGRLVGGADQMFTTVDDTPAGGGGGDGGAGGGGGDGGGGGAGDGGGGNDGGAGGAGAPGTVSSCVVPSLKGLTLRKARKRLRAQGCRLGKVRGHGRHVLAQSRRPGRKLKLGAKVGVSVQ